MTSTNYASWILVTGTSTGIGRAATFTLAENGYRVLAAVRKQKDIESLLAEAGTRRFGGSVEPIILDVTDAGQIAAAVEIVRARITAGGRLHAIVQVTQRGTGGCRLSTSTGSTPEAGRQAGGHHQAAGIIADR
jgi:NAD(P)-dependent dehydrogenase (short-subunit alcohol dehydrogenase family)